VAKSRKINAINMNITISKLNIDEWPKYKALRLEALQNDPSSFGQSYNDILKSPDEKWKEQLQKSHNNDGSVMFFAKDKDRLVGMLGALWDYKEKTKHLAKIVGVYVSPNYRGRGIGKLLMETILKYLNDMPQIEKIKLGVVTKQTTALKMYEKHGFKHVGKLEKELKVDNQYFDEYLMEKFKG
jgi:ribosomal protein S18 acetylase RimI-like enzyme